MGGKTASISEDTLRTQKNQEKLEVTSEIQTRCAIMASKRY